MFGEGRLRKGEKNGWDEKRKRERGKGKREKFRETVRGFRRESSVRMGPSRYVRVDGDKVF